MPNRVLRLFRFAAACLFLGQAWLHFFYPAPYAGIVPKLPESLEVIDLDLASKIAGGWFLLSGVLALVARPKWLVGFVVLLCTLPLGILNYAWAQAGSASVVSFAAGASLLLLPLALASALWGWNGVSKLLLRVGLTSSFATFGILASGLQFTHYVPNIGDVEIGLPQSKSWADLTERFLPMVESKHRDLGLVIAGGVMLAAVLGLWFRFSAGVSGLFLSLLALIGVASVTVANLGPDLLNSLHRWLPESVFRLPIAILPVVLWRMAVYRVPEDEGEPDAPEASSAAMPTKNRKRKKRKKLKRVETPPEVMADPRAIEPPDTDS